jgi:hypothetical protein
MAGGGAASAQRTEGPNPITGNLAGYVALLHLCGAEALGDEPLPMVEVDPWTGMAFGRGYSPLGAQARW